MRLLLDSHALYWALVEPERLSSVAREEILTADNEVFASAVSFYELTFKAAIGKLAVAADLIAETAAAGCELLPLTPRQARRAGALPLHHRDPFDRLLVAQAQSEGLTVVTRDPAFASYEVALLAA